MRRRRGEAESSRGAGGLVTFATMADLADGETKEAKGSAAKPYLMKNTGGVYSCTCPAWRNQDTPIERRTCKHLRALRGDAAETERLGVAPPPRAAGADEGDEAKGPPILLAHSWENDVDLTGWWVSEKLDGVRAYWDGKSFISRLGNPYLAPDWFIAGLPPIPLDGELWGGRKAFQKTISIVRRQDRSEHWRDILFVVFDAPAVDAPFEERVALCQRHLAGGAAPYARHLEQSVCRGVDHMRDELRKVEALGGEGLMLRQPGSRYEVGRSTTLLKVKSFHDAEARVVGYVPGAGKHKGRTGALLVEMPDGTQFAVGTGLSDAERKSPPPVGSVITYRYQELSTGGVPRFPSFVCIREDLPFPPPAPKPAAPASPAPEAPKASSAPEAPKAAAAPKAAKAPKAAAAPEAAKAAGATAAAPAAPGGKRRFEASEGGSEKFWEIELSGASHTVSYGRLGSAGQSKTKSFASAEAARGDADKLIGEKTKKGYVEVTGAP